jgi:hypothetical protein
MPVASTQRSIQRLGEALSLREPELVEAMLRRNTEEAPDFATFVEEPELAAAVRESARTNLREAIAALVRDREAPQRLPTGALEEARSAARSGVPLSALLQTYRIGHAVVWEAVIDEVEALDLRPEARRDLLRVVTRFAFAYIDGVMPLVTEAYARERKRLLGLREQRRVQLVRDLLAGNTVDASELSYDLDRSHVAFVIGGEDGVASLQALGELAKRPCLAVGASERTAWGWLGSRDPWREEEVQRLVEADALVAHVVAVGEPGAGAQGFRDSHTQALRAVSVGEAKGQRVTRFRDVAFEALALRDAPAARAFAEAELRPLERAKDTAKLRETLRAYFAVGLNASAAAVLLGVHERTVGYRLRVIEELIGAPLPQRRFELEAALRLSDTLGDDARFR